MKKISVQQMVLTAMMAALIAVFSWISIPLPSGVPATLQTLGISLAGYVMGPVYGLVSVLVWLLLGIVGLPVFAGFGSGIGSLLGYTGGFLIGFPIMAVLCGLGKKRPVWLSVVLGLLGLAVVEVLGALQYGILSGNAFGAAFVLVVVPYLVKDIICVVLMAIVSRQLNKALASVMREK